jgi:hypothetical protein
MSSVDRHGHQTAAAERVPRERRGRLRQLWRDYQWPLILTLLAISFLLGYVGFRKYATATGTDLAPPDILYLTLQLATLESGAVSGPVSWELEAARWLVPILTAYTAVLAAAVLFRRQLQMVRLWFIRGHVVICGLGEKGYLLARGFRERGYGVVAIEQDEIRPHIGLCRDQGVIVLVGDAAEPALLKRAAVHRARHVISVCGADDVNVEVAIGTRQLAAKRKSGAVTCSILLVHPQLCALLREQELTADAYTPFRLELFNVFERGARTMLRVHPAWESANGEDAPSPHLLVVGLGRMGESLLVHAARDWYAEHRGTDKRLRVSVVDLEAEQKLESLAARYPQLPACCELAGNEIDVADVEFQKGRFLFDEEGSCDLDMVYVCLSDAALGLQAGLTIRQRLGRDEPQIVVRMGESSGLASLLWVDGGKRLPFRNLHPFGLLERTCTPTLVLDGTHEVLAQAVHEAYRQGRRRKAMERQQGELDGQAEESLEEDKAMQPWESLPEPLKESNRRQVDHIRAMLQAAGYGIKPLTDWEAMSYEFEPEEVEFMARLEHERYVEERTREGWVSGPERDVKKRTNPNLGPWEKLQGPAIQNNLNSVIELPKVLARGEFQVYRLAEEPESGMVESSQGSEPLVEEDKKG